MQIRNYEHFFELDSGSRDNVCSVQVWKQWERPDLKRANTTYVSATGDRTPTIGVCSVTASTTESEISLEFNVTKLQKLNILGRKAIVALKMDVSTLLQSHVLEIEEDSDDKSLQKECQKSARNSKNASKLNWDAWKISNQHQSLLRLARCHFRSKKI